MEPDSERIEVRAGIDSVGGYLAHADQANLVEVVTGMKDGQGDSPHSHEDQAKQTWADVPEAQHREPVNSSRLLLPWRRCQTLTDQGPAHPP